jgi:hypothetical protein
MGSKSKNKGKGFERDVAKYLSDLYGDNFVRVFSSGAYTGGMNNFRKDTLTEGQIRANKGDISPPDDWNHFNCECKAYNSFAFHKLFYNEKIPLLEEFINQTMEASDDGDVNIIFMKFDYVGKYIAYQLPRPFECEKYIDYSSKDHGVWRFTEFESFFQKNKEIFEKECKKQLTLV